MDQEPAESPATYTTPTHKKVGWAMLSGFLELTALGQVLASFLFKVTPDEHKRAMALRLISVSTHFFIYQWSDRYPRSMTYGAILEAEHQRNIDSREEIASQLLAEHLGAEMTVLDFGCGPGYLARHAAKSVKKLYGADISQTAILCARQLNSSANISYQTSKDKDLGAYADSSLDLIYSFAVVQHIEDDLFEAIIGEFQRILKPNGKCVCHVILIEDVEAGESPAQPSFFVKHLRGKLVPPMNRRTEGYVRRTIEKAGFSAPSVAAINEISTIRDDVGQQHLFVFKKPIAVN